MKIDTQKMFGQENADKITGWRRPISVQLKSWDDSNLRQRTERGEQNQDITFPLIYLFK